MLTILLLFMSNTFMTIAWYWHVKYKHFPLWQVVLISWSLAFFEYCLAVPANRLGYGTFTAFQLKVIQEVITLLVFTIFSFFFFKEKISVNHFLSFFFILCAVYFAFKK